MLLLFLVHAQQSAVMCLALKTKQLLQATVNFNEVKLCAGLKITRPHNHIMLMVNNIITITV